VIFNGWMSTLSSHQCLDIVGFGTGTATGLQEKLSFNHKGSVPEPLVQ